ncbi:hypothetical protein FA95DRAFT_1565330 [Auriscalpium vulgare]|uniref:Uncharacterized protein n=1 Tax=Auriscalpium vulgare TaxID=40419 RepID=A0ACB8RBJ8_9AGAM|nr:hypothetical protein FA95DRAFT_1565330 [Auriscalpium vulgare]
MLWNAGIYRWVCTGLLKCKRKVFPPSPIIPPTIRRTMPRAAKAKGPSSRAAQPKAQRPSRAAQPTEAKTSTRRTAQAKSMVAPEVEDSPSQDLVLAASDMTPDDEAPAKKPRKRKTMLPLKVVFAMRGKIPPRERAPGHPYWTYKMPYVSPELLDHLLEHFVCCDDPSDDDAMRRHPYTIIHRFFVEKKAAQDKEAALVQAASGQTSVEDAAVKDRVGITRVLKSAVCPAIGTKGCNADGGARVDSVKRHVKKCKGYKNNKCFGEWDGVLWYTVMTFGEIEDLLADPDTARRAARSAAIAKAAMDNIRAAARGEFTAAPDVGVPPAVLSACSTPALVEDDSTLYSESPSPLATSSAWQSPSPVATPPPPPAEKENFFLSSADKRAGHPAKHPVRAAPYTAPPVRVSPLDAHEAAIRLHGEARERWVLEPAQQMAQSIMFTGRVPALDPFDLPPPNFDPGNHLRGLFAPDFDEGTGAGMHFASEWEAMPQEFSFLGELNAPF